MGEPAPAERRAIADLVLVEVGSSGRYGDSNPALEFDSRCGERGRCPEGGSARGSKQKDEFDQRWLPNMLEYMRLQ
jgi:hypothetical protein